MSVVRGAAVSAVTVALAVGFAPSAWASHGGGGGVVKTGMCSAGSDWKLKAKTDDGKIEVEYEVDSNVVGQTWRVRLTDNGSQIFAGTRKTVAPSGSFEVRVLTANRTGKDTIVGTAMNVASGEQCRGTVTL